MRCILKGFYHASNGSAENWSWSFTRPKASVSLIVGCSTETTSGSTRPPIIETEVWGPLSVRHCTEQMVRFGRTAMNEICYEIFTLYILIHAAI